MVLLLGCALAASFATPAYADFSEYEVQSASASLSSYQAGEHADFTSTFKIRSELSGGDVAQTRDVVIDLPAGLIGNPNVVPKCTVEELGQNIESSHCPVASQIGVTVLDLENRPFPATEPLYNMPAPGEDIVARFGFMAGLYPAIINVRVRSEGDYGVSATVEGAAGLVGLRGATTTIWGVPASPVHDTQRITPEEGTNNEGPPGGKRSAGIPPKPFLSNPTRCGVPLNITVSADSYQEPGVFSSKSASFGPLGGCGKLDFKPSFSVSPSTHEAAAPTGLDIDLKIPQDETEAGRATSQLKDATVVFPEGMTIASGAADGLQACSAAEAGYQSRSPGNCPAASKLGTVEFDVPALEHVVNGAIYQRTPEPGHLFRVWIVADELGAHIALPGDIGLDPLTGRITTRFLDNPQVPVREIRLHIFGGPRAPLSTPSTCGTYSAHWELTPWSGQPTVVGDAPLTIDTGCDTGGLNPGLSAGTLNPRAGAFSAFTLDLTRQAGEQNISRLEVKLPPGLVAKLAGVPLCEGAAAASGTCSPSSQVGTVSVASGPGSSPLWIPQPGKSPTAIYLGGPYKGAPYSLVISVPAQAGPFDLGTVTVRSAIRVDSETARVSIGSDPLPQILEGVPVSYRVIHAQVDRAKFTLNATSCNSSRIKALVESPSGSSATAEAAYQATDCAKLAYSPRLSMKLKGGVRRTGHPALSAVLSQGRGQANNAAATVVLPSSQFIDQGHISNPCTRVQFNADACPVKSVLGHARAFSPLLDEPLEGPVYFRSNGGDRELPDIVADLRGPLHIVVVGFVDSVGKKGSEVSRTRTRFANLPDAPVTKFTMRLFGGKRGLLVNSTNLCSRPQKARIELRGQNGKLQRKSLTISTPCGKKGSAGR
jgi:hypothetical protein